MQSDDSFFGALGSTLGEVIRTIVAALKYVLGGLGEAIGEFSTGLAHAMGMDATVFNFILLVLGVMFLWWAIKSLLRGAILAFVLWLVLAVLVLSGLVG